MEKEAAKNTFRDKIYDIYTESEAARRTDIDPYMLTKMVQEEVYEVINQLKLQHGNETMKRLKRIIEGYAVNKILDHTTPELRRLYHESKMRGSMFENYKRDNIDDDDDFLLSLLEMKSCLQLAFY